MGEQPSTALTRTVWTRWLPVLFGVRRVCLAGVYAWSVVAMFKEFFWDNWKTGMVAWGGLIVVVAYSAFLAYIKAELNEFYSTFYDLLQEAGGLAASSTSESSSGDIYGDAAGSGQNAELAVYRARVYEQLWLFAGIIAPLVTASPACKWIRSIWAFSWRMSLMSNYLRAWDTKREPIEGASQRLHEDSQRFSSALQGCLVAVLDSVFTLIVFSPILFQLSRDIRPPINLGALEGAWLWTTAWLASIVGLMGSVFLGQKLVQLEVDNQRVEALLRKDLVLLETTPAVIVGTQPRDAQQSQPTPQTPEQARQPSFKPRAYFDTTLVRLRSNYHALFRHFSLLNLWLSFYDQIMVIFPYIVAAPLIFDDDPVRRITLGTLIKMSNSFEKVFSSLSVISESWGAINEFRSTLYRLREFEAKLYADNAAPGSSGCLLTTGEGGARTPTRSDAACHSRSSSHRGRLVGPSGGGGAGPPSGPTGGDGGSGGGGSGGGGGNPCCGNGGRICETQLVVQGAPLTVHGDFTDAIIEQSADLRDMRV